MVSAPKSEPHELNPCSLPSLIVLQTTLRTVQVQVLKHRNFLIQALYGKTPSASGEVKENDSILPCFRLLAQFAELACLLLAQLHTPSLWALRKRAIKQADKRASRTLNQDTLPTPPFSFLKAKKSPKLNLNVGDYNRTPSDGWVTRKRGGRRVLSSHWCCKKSYNLWYYLHHQPSSLRIHCQKRLEKD